MTNQTVTVAALPDGELTPGHFAMAQAAMPDPGEGEVLLRTILMSIDAANRSWMQGATYRAAVNAGDVMPTYAISEVIHSNSPRLAAGDIVAGEGEWAEYIVRPARQLQKMPDVQPLSHLMSVYGIAGKTAFHGLVGVGQPIAGGKRCWCRRRPGRSADMSDRSPRRWAAGL